MAADVFAKIGDIKGESTDDKHKDEVELLSWSWGVSTTGAEPQASTGGTGQAHFSDFHFTHRIDKASPALFKMCATGEHIKEAPTRGSAFQTRWRSPLARRVRDSRSS